MANKIDTSELTGNTADLLKAYELLGLSELIGEPGSYTCYHAKDMFDVEIGILPGRFSAREVEDLFKAAALPEASVAIPAAHLFLHAA